MVQYILENAPESANIHDNSGKLHIHLATNHGCKLESIIALVQASSPPQSISKPDLSTGLMPFMLACSHK